MTPSGVTTKSAQEDLKTVSTVIVIAQEDQHPAYPDDDRGEDPIDDGTITASATPGAQCDVTQCIAIDINNASRQVQFLAALRLTGAGSAPILFSTVDGSIDNSGTLLVSGDVMLLSRAVSVNLHPPLSIGPGETTHIMLRVASASGVSAAAIPRQTVGIQLQFGSGRVVTIDPAAATSSTIVIAGT